MEPTPAQAKYKGYSAPAALFGGLPPAKWVGASMPPSRAAVWLTVVAFFENRRGLRHAVCHVRQGEQP